MTTTVYDKIWGAHVLEEINEEESLIYIDRHMIHEVTSPQAFFNMREKGREVRRSGATLAVCDHNIPTKDLESGIKDEDSRKQVEYLRKNSKDFGIALFDITDRRCGIVHVVGPEQGFTLPGTTIVCGDSHTSTHGAFGALAFGIGTTEVEHVLATQTLVAKKSKNMRISVEGSKGLGFTAKDVILTIIGKIGTKGGTGHVIEYMGSVIEGLSLEGRMTVCNMSIEGGARGGLIAPDEKTYKYLEGLPMSPKGDEWDSALKYWRELQSAEGAYYDKSVEIDISGESPKVTWGTSPEHVLDIDGYIPKISEAKDEKEEELYRQIYKYMGYNGGERLEDIKIDKVFIGSCTNARIEDLRSASRIVEGRSIASEVSGMVVPGSGLVKEQAESEGIDKIFKEAGFEWRSPGCSMCLAMNDDKLQIGERCASTSNRNFEGRQGRGGRTHLMSPELAVACAVTGRLSDLREFL